MKSKAKAVLVLALLSSALFVSGALAQENGTLSGTVSWRSTHFGEGRVEGAIVTVYDSINAEFCQDTSSSDGSYNFSLPPGLYHASFTKEKYRDSTLSNIQIAPNQTTLADIYLKWLSNCSYHIGDVNGRGHFTGLDVVYAIAYLKGGPEPFFPCECVPGTTWFTAGDVNASCTFTGLDVTYMVNDFKGGPYSRPCPDCLPVGDPY